MNYSRAADQSRDPANLIRGLADTESFVKKWCTDVHILMPPTTHTDQFSYLRDVLGSTHYRYWWSKIGDAAIDVLEKSPNSAPSSPSEGEFIYRILRLIEYFGGDAEKGVMVVGDRVQSEIYKGYKVVGPDPERPTSRDLQCEALTALLRCLESVGSLKTPNFAAKLRRLGRYLEEKSTCLGYPYTQCFYCFLALDSKAAVLLLAKLVDTVLDDQNVKPLRLLRLIAFKLQSKQLDRELLDILKVRIHKEEIEEIERSLEKQKTPP